MSQDKLLMLDQFPLSPDQIHQCYDGGKNTFWCEWYTAYFYGSSANDLCGMINMAILRSGPLECNGRAFVYPAFSFDSNQKSNNWNGYPINGWNFESVESAFGLSICNEQSLMACMEADDENNIRIYGRDKHGSVYWDLVIQNATSKNGFMIADHVQVNYESIPTNQYLSFATIIPAGNVTGSVNIDGRIFKVDCFGEVEHVWGKVLLPMLSWSMIHGFDSNNKTLLYWVHIPGEYISGCICVINCAKNEHITHKWCSNEYAIIKNDGNISLNGVNGAGFIVKANVVTLSDSATQENMPSEKQAIAKITITRNEYVANYECMCIVEENNGGFRSMAKIIAETVLDWFV